MIYLHFNKLGEIIFVFDKQWFDKLINKFNLMPIKINKKKNKIKKKRLKKKERQAKIANKQKTYTKKPMNRKKLKIN